MISVDDTAMCALYWSEASARTQRSTGQTGHALRGSHHAVDAGSGSAGEVGRPAVAAVVVKCADDAVGRESGAQAAAGTPGQVAIAHRWSS